jgi:hypothetical protein
MIFKARGAIVCALLGLVVLAAAEAGFSEGQCGAPYKAPDGNTYTCGTTRAPFCENSTGRCQCLERKACGGTQDEPW